MKKKEDLFEKYNNKIVTKNLINYLIDDASNFYQEDTIKIIVNSNIKEKIDIVDLIKEGLQKEYTKEIKNYYHNNIIQFIYLLIGVFLLFVSSLVIDSVFKEVILIGGWVFIWALLEMELFTDSKGRKRRKIIQKLLNSKFKVISVH